MINPKNWAKLQRDEKSNAITAWHSIEDHSADVAACFEVLLKHTILGRRLAKISGRGSFCDVQQQRMCVFAALHDVGKFNNGFQNKQFDDRRKPTAGHLREILNCLTGKSHRILLRKCAQAIDINSLASWLESSDRGLSIIKRTLAATWSHHGKPLVYLPLENRWVWKSGVGHGDPFENIATFMESIRHWYPEAFGQHEGVDPLPAHPAFGHALCGLVTLADWLGSSTNFFPMSNGQEADRITLSRERASRVIQHMGLNPKIFRSSMVESPHKFSAVSHHPPRPIQDIVEGIETAVGAEVVIIEAETGSGKTEAAFLEFSKRFHMGSVDGLYFAVPTRTAATQIHKRARKIVARIFPDPQTRPSVVQAVPGYLQVDDKEGRRLAPFKVLWPDDKEQKMRYRGWAGEHSKRYLVGTVVIGTIDQLLLSTLTVKHAHMRAVASWRHLLVIDEVHASDTYMTRLTEAVLERHIAAGGQALLMSATLGSVARARLLRPSPQTHLNTPGIKESLTRPYPLVSVWREVNDHISLYSLDECSAQEDKNCLIDCAPHIDNPEFIAMSALDAAQKGARVLVIRNTVVGALAVQTALERLANTPSTSSLLFRVGEVVTLHHSRFSRADRIALDDAIEQQLGEHSTQPRVVIATQTVQQSLDLDADFLITDLCPMDILLQRIGRLHRHQRPRRPVGFEEPRTVLLTPANRDLSSRMRPDGQTRSEHGIGGLIYSDLRVIEATWRLLERHHHLVIPQMNRALVEQSTHPEALNRVTQELGGLWSTHEASIEGRFRAENVSANLALVDWSKPMGEYGYSALKDLRISTRLGEGDRLVHFDPPLVGPFGHELSKLSIPAFLVQDADPNDGPVNIEVTLGVIRFEFGIYTLQYNRLGLSS